MRAWHCHLWASASWVQNAHDQGEATQLCNYMPSVPLLCRCSSQLLTQVFWLTQLGVFLQQFHHGGSSQLWILSSRLVFVQPTVSEEVTHLEAHNSKGCGPCSHKTHKVFLKLAGIAGTRLGHKDNNDTWHMYNHDKTNLLMQIHCSFTFMLLKQVI